MVFLAAIGVFALQNRDVITVNFLRWNVSQPLAFVTVVAYFLGIANLPVAGVSALKDERTARNVSNSHDYRPHHYLQWRV